MGEFARMRGDLDIAPDAMEIVSQVVDKLAGGSKDKMEVESRDNLAPKLVSYLPWIGCRTDTVPQI
jgi:hypothetical protein